MCRTRSGSSVRRPLSRPLFMLFVLSILGVPSSGTAQNRGGENTFLAIPDAFPDVDARAIVVREPGRDVILLRDSELTAEAVAMSLLVLQKVRTSHPRPEQGQMIPITGFAVTDPPAGEYRDRLEAALRHLQRAQVGEMGSLGSGRWIRLR